MINTKIFKMQEHPLLTNKVPDFTGFFLSIGDKQKGAPNAPDIDWRACIMLTGGRMVIGCGDTIKEAMDDCERIYGITVGLTKCQDI